MTKEAFIKAVTVANGLFGLQFLFMPSIPLNQFFNKVRSRCHLDTCKAGELCLVEIPVYDLILLLVC